MDALFMQDHLLGNTSKHPFRKCEQWEVQGRFSSSQISYHMPVSNKLLSHISYMMKKQNGGKSGKCQNENAKNIIIPTLKGNLCVFLYVTGQIFLLQNNLKSEQHVIEVTFYRRQVVPNISKTIMNHFLAISLCTCLNVSLEFF